MLLIPLHELIHFCETQPVNNPEIPLSATSQATTSPPGPKPLQYLRHPRQAPSKVA
jgi:hypothetical protein